jgi:tRNA 2-thiouridine synthesizing protein A
MNITLDLTGLSCPIPLIQTKNALNEADVVTVIVDEPAAKENIIKFAKSQHYAAECTDDHGCYTIVIRK